MASEPRRQLPVPLPVEVRLPGGGVQLEYAVNLSASGLCLHVRRPVPVGTSVELAFTLPPEGPRVRTSARVVWFTCEQERTPHNRFCEMGLEFEGLGEFESERIRHYVREEIKPRIFPVGKPAA